MKLEELLSQPLPPVPDDGFSARVMSRVAAEQRLRQWAAVAAVAACAGFVMLFLPLGPVGAALGDGLPRAVVGAFGVAFRQLISSWAVNLGLAAIVLSFLVERQFSQS